MSNNEPPENFISKLPPAPLVKPDIADGVIPLPAAALLSESERKRLDELAGATPPDPEALKTEFRSFSDGSFMKYFPRPEHPPQCVLVDADGQQVAIARNEDVANFLVNASNLFVLAHLKNQVEGEQMQIISRPIIIP